MQMNVALNATKGIEERSTLQLYNLIYKNELKTIQNIEGKQGVKENNSETSSGGQNRKFQSNNIGHVMRKFQ